MQPGDGGARREAHLEVVVTAPAAAIAPELAELAVPIESLKPYGRNPRRGDVPAITRSLEVNGQYRPIVANRRTGEVLAGNHTWLSARALGWSEIAATFVDVDDEQAKRIVLADNRTAELGGYDDGELAELLGSLPELDGTGWQGRDLDRLLDDLARSGDDAARDTEPGPVPAEPITQPGDLWRLGEHRLVCGDATAAGDVARALAGELAEMVWTDPPYGVDYVGRTAAKLTFENDGKAGLRGLLEPALQLALEATRPGGAIYLMHADADPDDTARAACRDVGWEIHQRLIWVKQSAVLSRHDYHWQHEPILYGWRPGAAHRWNAGYTETTLVDGERDPRELSKRELVTLVRELRNRLGTTVIREDRPTRSDLHPTTKPVGLVARTVLNSSRRAELVYEPFGGSRTTVLACENTGRRCAAVELEPGYCDVIVDRWQRHTGGVAELEARA